ncbi:aminotransferase class I/II-fold pyridoxal phosphate-dependent enzyme [Micromonospora cathayae]|uniref:8-amino-7-oxononanoate synthase n=1 Tax=Micromonospora cathayae TaxID=3028804 RepID=A0ABY7ZIT8_9ACTN|nr:aminotransferase class I/II-fold pyridoxal phosphate-dependent enzyme [Micromonospora sp. HUAS 3]WDZ82897.1 aminotransferase class I/II-fold pyridoxal phosphate-dependent enzyme [Micromonospora sp. HUAS 3]
MDFTSSSYLGYRHGHAELSPWQALTTGRPAGLAEFPQADRLARDVARRMGRADAVLATSTLHGLVDVWSVLHRQPTVALIDEAAYPIARMALRVSGAAGDQVVVPHFGAAAVARAVRALPLGVRPVLLVDGLCTGCGRLAPIPDLLTALAPRRGLVLVDDTQAFGLVGAAPDPGAPYGHGGGGVSAALALPPSARLVVVASAAKAFGAPLAVVAGPPDLIDLVRRYGPCRVHASAPSAASQAALGHALADDADAAARRVRLDRLVRVFRARLRDHGVSTANTGNWPTQLVPVTAAVADRTVDRLRRAGVRTVCVRPACGTGLRLIFLVTADHRMPDVIGSGRAVARIVSTGPPGHRPVAGHRARPTPIDRPSAILG